MIYLYDHCSQFYFLSHTSKYDDTAKNIEYMSVLVCSWALGVRFGVYTDVALPAMRVVRSWELRGGRGGIGEEKKRGGVGFEVSIFYHISQ